MTRVALVLHNMGNKYKRRRIQSVVWAFHSTPSRQPTCHFYSKSNTNCVLVLFILCEYDAKPCGAYIYLLVKGYYEKKIAK